MGTRLRVRELAEERGIKLGDLAERAGISEGYISKNAGGKQRTNTDVLQRLARELRCQVPDLFVREAAADVGEAPRNAARRPEEPDHPPSYTGNLEPGITLIDNTDYASLQRFDARLSAGPGSLLEEDPEPLGYHLVEAQWLRAITSTAPENLMVVMVDGDSMEPTLSHEDWVLVDRHQKRAQSQGLFAFRFAEVVWVKRLQPSMSKGVVRILSDNPRYEPDETSPEDIDIIGRVIAIVARKM